MRLVSPVKIDAKISERYQQVMREWKACEVIVKQREKEMQSAIFAKLSSGSSIDSHVLRLVHRDSTLSNEVRSIRTVKPSRQRVLTSSTRSAVDHVASRCFYGIK